MASLPLTNTILLKVMKWVSNPGDRGSLISLGGGGRRRREEEAW